MLPRPFFILTSSLPGITLDMELFEYARPDLMSGKKILYVHGFASGGQNGTVRTMRLLLPEAEIIAPDLPVRPQEALAMLKDICMGPAVS